MKRGANAVDDGENSHVEKKLKIQGVNTARPLAIKRKHIDPNNLFESQKKRAKKLSSIISLEEAETFLADNYPILYEMHSFTLWEKLIYAFYPNMDGNMVKACALQPIKLFVESFGPWEAHFGSIKPEFDSESLREGIKALIALSKDDVETIKELPIDFNIKTILYIILAKNGNAEAYANLNKQDRYWVFYAAAGISSVFNLQSLIPCFTSIPQAFFMSVMKYVILERNFANMECLLENYPIFNKENIIEELFLTLAKNEISLQRYLIKWPNLSSGIKGQALAQAAFEGHFQVVKELIDTQTIIPHAQGGAFISAIKAKHFNLAKAMLNDFNTTIPLEYKKRAIEILAFAELEEKMNTITLDDFDSVNCQYKAMIDAIKINIDLEENKQKLRTLFVPLQQTKAINECQNMTPINQTLTWQPICLESWDLNTGQKEVHKKRF